MLCKVHSYRIVLSNLLISFVERLRDLAQFDPIHIDAQ